MRFARFIKRRKNNCCSSLDYAVHIPPGSHSDALCETSITWLNEGKEFITRGLDSDQTVSAIKATENVKQYSTLNMKLNIALLAGDGIGPENH